MSTTFGIIVGPVVARTRRKGSAARSSDHHDKEH